jgi:hypothetical protein
VILEKFIWHRNFTLHENRKMEKETDPIRNRPAVEGRDNDPNVRDEDARRPGVNTMSSTDQDSENEKVSETAADNFREEKKDQRADPRFDEIDKNDA